MGWFRDLGREKPWAQGCVIAGAGLLLGVSGCFGFLFTIDLNGGRTSPLVEALSTGLAILFGIGALAIPVGVVWWIVGLVSTRRRSRSGAPPTAS